MARTNLYETLVADRVGPAPIVIRAVVTPNTNSMAGGVPGSTAHIENYICVSMLPPDLQERVKVVIEALIAGM